jgi:hypothetical protein
VRSAVRRSDPRLRALVALLDQDGVPTAATWRLVAAAAESKGLLRPSYPLIRRLVALERLRRRRRDELREALLEAASTLGAGGVPNFDYTARRIGDAHRRVAELEARGSETQGIERALAARPSSYAARGSPS